MKISRNPFHSSDHTKFLLIGLLYIYKKNLEMYFLEIFVKFKTGHRCRYFFKVQQIKIKIVGKISNRTRVHHPPLTHAITHKLATIWPRIPKASAHHPFSYTRVNLAAVRLIDPEYHTSFLILPFSR